MFKIQFMRRFYFIAILFVVFTGCKKEEPVPNTPSPAVQNISGTYNHTVEVNGVSRQYIVYVPASANGGTNAPVLFMIHGTNQTGQYHYSTNLWNSKAEQEGFIVVYPTALIYCHYDDGVERTCTKWAAGDLGETDVNLGALPMCPGQVLNDDVAFFDEMINEIKSEYSVDNKRIYATGFSNGAQMTSRLAAERSDIFAAVAVHAGNLSNFIPANLSSRPMSMVITVGANDGLFTSATGISNPAPIDQTLMNNSGVTAMIQRFLDINGLSNQFTYSSSQIGGVGVGHFNYSTSLSGESNFVQFSIIENLGHNYTNILIDDYWSFLASNTLP